MNSGRQPPESNGAAHDGTGTYSLAAAATISAAVQHQPGAPDRKRLALRGTAATLLYRLQGRL
ncbi:hypothetical protein [Synechococcus sp. BA-132 BA5]|uniref:hypothetical protein n=1 Tax=Synechococcus sp. BA-132 BA5 TaxID=3110252 RepID=UPI002B20A68A|nr:hypothetical protein [Synechococcus sp. BA-132 BA5]MEA5416271.1 hypothetical protein [Synechococcus sp. BA-132 BA5]